MGLVPVILLVVAVMVSAGIGLALSQRSSALDFVGPVAAGEIGKDGGTHRGEVVGFAMPQMKNVSDQPLQIVGFQLDQVPRGTSVVGFRLLSVHDTKGVQLGSFPVNHRCDDRSEPGYDCYPDYLPSHPEIKPGHISDLYPVVYLRVLTPPRDHISQGSGCEYLYTLQGVDHQQQAPCSFTIGPKE